MSRKVYVHGYVRVSTTMQVDEGVSMAAQEEKIRLWALSKNYTIKKIWIEAGISGKNTENRPQLIELLETVKKNQYVCVYSMSRLARNTRDTMNILELIKSKGAFLVILDNNYDTSDAQGKLLFDLMAGFSEFESSQISCRVKMAMDHMKNNGTLRNRPPFGYKFVGKKVPFEEDPEEQQILKRIHDLVEANPLIKNSAICKHLIDTGVKCRNAKTWYPNRIDNIRKQQLWPFDFQAKERLTKDVEREIVEDHKKKIIEDIKKGKPVDRDIAEGESSEEE